jgi:hypothetical protein
VLLEREILEADLLAQAIKATFERRAMSAPYAGRLADGRVCTRFFAAAVVAGAPGAAVDNDMRCPPNYISSWPMS